VESRYHGEYDPVSSSMAVDMRKNNYFPERYRDPSWRKSNWESVPVQVNSLSNSLRGSSPRRSAAAASAVPDGDGGRNA
jgi:hypothetical protein